MRCCLLFLSLEIGSLLRADSSPTAVQTVVGEGYHAGRRLTISSTLSFSGESDSAVWDVLLPDGWSFVSSTASGAAASPVPGSTGLLEWTWQNPTAGPIAFTYTVQVPRDARGRAMVSTMATVEFPGEASKIMAQPDPLLVYQLAP